MPSSRASEAAEHPGPRDEAGPAEQDAERRPPERSPEELTQELARLEDRFKRAAADLDNYRKRVARDIERRVEGAREALLREWLEVVDSLERALRQEPDGPLAEGLRAVREQMDAVLARSGVERIDAVGERFDPERHEAVDVRDSDDAENGTILEVVRSGYSLGGRVLRPAQVVVARRRPPAG
jgi:molecular chaperone GrpE